MLSPIPSLMSLVDINVITSFSTSSHKDKIIEDTPISSCHPSPNVAYASSSLSLNPIEPQKMEGKSQDLGIHPKEKRAKTILFHPRKCNLVTKKGKLKEY